MINVEDKTQMNLKFLATKINEIIEHVASLQQTPAATVVRDRGPKSFREMTEDDARKIMLGELKDASHKDAALKLQLSYGQIYSARKGFTFKTIGKEKELADMAAKVAKEGTTQQ